MVASTATSRSCGTRLRFGELYNAQWIVEKNGYLSLPLMAASGVARRDLKQARRVRQTCVRRTPGRYIP